MKPILKLLSVAAFTCWAVQAGDTNGVGRYQLLIARTDGSRGGSARNTLYRIDTVTGQTWDYSEMEIRGTNAPVPLVVGGWTLMSEDLSLGMYLATRGAKGTEHADAEFPWYSSSNYFAVAQKLQFLPPGRREAWEAKLGIDELTSLRSLATNPPPGAAKPAGPKRNQ